MNDKTKGDPQNEQEQSLLDPGYLEYKRDGYSMGVFIVRHAVDEIDTRNKWVHVIHIDADTFHYRRKRIIVNKFVKYPGYSEEVLRIRSLKVEIFNRKKHPKYPEYPEYEGQPWESYQETVNYICWKTATEDIAEQRDKGVRGPRYRVDLQLYDKNKGKKHDDPYDIPDPKWDHKVVSVKKF
ncbi:MAG: hypothetical protein IJT95_05650 [Abditibacteriota bacterium]|nr:hypothetical protein [Abditibacteriota bacterium]